MKIFTFALYANTSLYIKLIKITYKKKFLPPLASVYSYIFYSFASDIVPASLHVCVYSSTYILIHQKRDYYILTDRRERVKNLGIARARLEVKFYATITVSLCRILESAEELSQRGSRRRRYVRHRQRYASQFALLSRQHAATSRDRLRGSGDSHEEEQWLVPSRL